MKTGFGESTGDFENQMMQSAIGIIQPVLEMGMVLAGKYAHACGRDTILSKDVEYAMKYCVMHTVGQKIGTHFPDFPNIGDLKIKHVGHYTNEECFR